MSVAPEPPLIRDLMRFKPEALSPNAWAVQAGVSRTVWADMRRHGNPSRRTLDKLLCVAGSSLAEFEALRVGDATFVRNVAPAAALGDVRAAGWRGAPRAPVPLLGTALAGAWGEEAGGAELTELRLDDTLALLPRPESLAEDEQAYALTIVGDAMWPRFRPGRRLLVSPRAPVAIGDDVVVRLRPGPGADPNRVEVLINELTGFGRAAHELRQFNPDRRIAIDAAQIEVIHKVVGEAY